MTDNRSRTTAPHVARLTMVLLTTTMLSGVPQALAQTLPTGGSVAAGSAAIGTPSNGALTVTQSSASAVVNWQSFSVGQGNTVNFVQPSSTSAILNRVTGSATSTIAGQINANGQVFLVNPNGIAITSTGTVNAAGFVASTLGISDSDFMAGKRSFTGNGASAGVSNAGNITIGRGGYAALLGGSVDNAGTINVPLGKVGLGSGEQATLDLSGDGFMQVAVPTNAAGSHALVSNSGRISANGGTVQLSAAAARDMARQAINMSGTIEARSVGGRNGAIVLGGSDGIVAVSGKLDVASRKAKGGSIAITGRDIKLAGATLDASGKTGGGAINIGGGRQGQGPLQRAESVAIDAATTIKADATQTGNGGSITVWSDGATAVHGLISATGGALSGYGGQIETSGHTLDFAGIRINASAANGKSGTWLLDPQDLTVDAAAAGTISTTLNGGTDVTLLTTATTASGPGNISTGNGDIVVNAGIGWSSSALLTLNAYNAIAINAPITVGGAGGVSLLYNAASPTNLTFAQGASIDYGATNHGGTLSVNGNAYTLLYSMTDVASINSNLGGHYALAASLDATSTTYATGVIASGTGSTQPAAFSGTFEGLGHTIANLTINGGSNNYVGLFGYSTGTIRDIGLTGGSVSGTSYVGGLVGFQDNGGTISNAYATGAVSGYSSVGGLAGYQNGGTISNAYATGAVSGTYNVGGLAGFQNGGTISNAYATGAVSGNIAVGGLIGLQNGGTISNAYATGAVSGNNYVGGLAGELYGGTINNAYATGAVSGNNDVGGLIGVQFVSTISNSYWDMQTSGQSSSAGGTGLTTAAFQTGGAFGLGSAFAGGANGLYPYLTSFYPNGAQAISGTAYADSGVTTAASGANGPQYVYIDIAGTQTAVTTGANGYYYVAVANGTLSSANGGTATLAYTLNGDVTGPVSGAHLASLAGTAQNFDIWGNTLIAPTTATSLSAAPTSGAALLTANSGTNQTLLTAALGSDTAATGVSGLSVAGYVATANAGFTVDQGISAYGLYLQTTNGPITVSSAQTLGGPINLELLSATTLAINAPIQVNGAGSVTLAYDASSPANLTFASGASLTFADSNGNALSASPGNQSLAINQQAYTLLYSMADVASINSNLGGAYALAASLDASSMSYTSGVVAGGNNTGIQPTAFSGAFDGLGHTIANLTINGSSNDFVGLFGYSMGTIRDIGLTGGSVSGNQYVGGLVGFQDNGTISNAYATGAVSGNLYVVGGLVGEQYGGTIINAYATGAVSGNTAIGGLVGYQDGGSTISNAYATGAVRGSTDVGGLAGLQSGGTISNAYATGAVSGYSSVGGLVGVQYGTINNSYWDTQTSGQSSSAGGTGLTTAAFQSGGASGLGSAFAGGANGLYPYLSSFYPNGVQAISGIAYTDSGVTKAASGFNHPQYVYVDIAGTRTAVTTGANGYYYVAVANGTLSSANGGTATLAYTLDGNLTGSVAGAHLMAATGTTANVDIWGNTLIAPTTATTLSAAPTNGATLLAANGSADQTLLTAALGSDTAATGVSSLTLAGYEATAAAGFTIDQGITANGLYARTTSGPIKVASAQTLGGPITLELLSASTLAINAPITVNGAGTVALAYDASSPTNLTFAQGASIDYGATNQGGTLAVNGNAYTLLYSMADVAQQNTSGFNAIATNLDASAMQYTSAVVGSFDGTLEGLGHTISNLTITSNSANLGLFDALTTSGVIRDLGLVGGSVSGVGAPYVGSLVGHQNGGMIVNVYATGAVSGYSSVGGLVGGQDGGTIVNVYATGAVSGTNYVGGLVGYQGGGTIGNAYATGAVHGSGYVVGGLVGSDYGGTISNAYATGAVSGSYNVGGLVGVLDGGGTISNAYATGAVSGNSTVGGLVGVQGGGTISNSYWDTQTSGQLSSAGGTGLTTRQLQGLDPVNGTTFSTIANLGDGTTSAFAGGANGLYPYLTSFYPNGVQAISGTAYTDSGVTMAASGANGPQYVYVDIAGTRTAVTTGANGYYYVAVANGTLSSANGGTATLAYTLAGNVTGPVAGAHLMAATGTTANVDIWGNTLIAPTTATTLSAAPTDATALLAANGSANQTLLNAALGSDTAATGVSSLSLAGYEATAAAGFTIDQGITANGLYVRTTSGPITVAAAQTLGGPINLELLSAGALAINAPITVNGAGSVTLAYDASSPGNLTFASGASLTFADSNGNPLSASPGNQSLAINGSSYTLLYSMADVASINSNLGGYYALAASLDASGTSYTTGIVADSINSPFSGAFEGLGQTISNLTINGGSNNFVGLFGYSAGTIRDIGLTGGSVSGADYVGGLVGYNSGGTISNAYATGAVSGAFYVGGLAGVQDGGAISSAYATGAVSGTFYAGGLVGYQSSGTISNAYATGAVSGTFYAGGLVGAQYGGTISNAYATGAVSGDYSAGGLVGAQGGGTIIASFFDTQASGQSNGVGSGSSTGVTGLTTAQMQNPFTFIAAGWDFATVWGRSTTGANGGDMMLRGLSTGLYDDYVQVAGNTSKTYGDANPALSGVSLTGVGTANVTLGWASGIDATTGAGTYSYAGGNVLAVTDAGARTVYTNYGSGALTVDTRAISVTADAQSRSYGNANPALTYTIGGLGLVNGDLLSGALATDADNNSAAGRYAITRGSLSASANYAVTFIPGTLTVDAMIVPGTPTLGAVNPPAGDLASTAANSTPPGMVVTPAMLPSTVPPPSGNGAGGTVLFADPRFDGIVICGGLNCVVAASAP